MPDYRYLLYIRLFHWTHVALGNRSPSSDMIYTSLSKSIGLIGSAVLALRLISSSR